MNEQAKPKHTNRLASESSPYLLQHAHNPVDWYPWGADAFEAACAQNKPIFLSVGYSTCYWCHVMERQCFEVEAIAAEMNQRFINIKVDREERPDVDQLYMTAVQVLTRHGGWPMSVFLLPDLRPFYGGTYFPPTDMHGRPGFVTILRGIEDAYRNRPADVEKTAGQIVEILKSYAVPTALKQAITVNDKFVDDLIRRSLSDFDPQLGGFGGAPKFPRETLLELLLVYLQTSGMGGSPVSSKAENTGGPPVPLQISNMLRRTLDAMADGGIRDHLGGGFHRYSTDAMWLVPHFEIMLYDNAMLAWCYVEASRQMNEPRYAVIARGIFDFVLREMTSPAGAFYTAIDAEVDGQEGLNYLWTATEIEAILGSEDARIFSAVYGVDHGPNFADPHHGSGVAEKNILFLPSPLPTAAAELKVSIDTLEARLAPMREKLYAARQQRKQPLLDTKIITSWNALMIRALAFGGKTLGDSRYVAAAEKAADFLYSAHRSPAGGLFRTSRDGAAKYDGFLDDYAFLAQAMLALFGATGIEKWKQRAKELAASTEEKFQGEEGGFYFTEKQATDLVVRQITATDSPLPSGNAIAAMVFAELGMRYQARDVLLTFTPQLESQAEGMSAMVQAALMYLRSDGSFTVSVDDSPPEERRPLTPQQIAKKLVFVEKVEWTSPLTLTIHLQILGSYHIHSFDTPPELSLIATRLTIVGEDDAEVNYPVAHELTTAFATVPVRVYSGPIQIGVRFSKPRWQGPPVVMNLTFQACDDSACLPPVTIAINSDQTRS